MVTSFITYVLLLVIKNLKNAKNIQMGSSSEALAKLSVKTDSVSEINEVQHKRAEMRPKQKSRKSLSIKCMHASKAIISMHLLLLQPYI